MASARSVVSTALAGLTMLAHPSLVAARLGKANATRAEEVAAPIGEPVPEIAHPAAAPKTEPSSAASEASEPLATLPATPFPNLTESKLLARGALGRGAEFWQGLETMSAAAVMGEGQLMGHSYLATTTVYADTNLASCGRLDTAAVVAGTGYYAVASAQAMQNSFPDGGSCCWCGRSTGHGTRTAPMGCASCAKGRFLPRRPYTAPLPGGNGRIFEQDIDVVVVDICPHQGNEAWCPGQAGATNQFGSHNHFDFARPPAGFDNFYFAFTPTPCSAEIEHRFRQMSQCSR